MFTSTAGIVPSAHVFGWPHGCHWSQNAFNKLVATLREVRISAGKLASRIGRIAEADVPEK